MKKLQKEKIAVANEITSLKVKLVQSLQLNKQMREESERTVKQMQRLFARLETLEQKEGERREYEEIKKEIEEAMRIEKIERERIHKEQMIIPQEVKMVEADPNTTREVNFKLDTDSEGGDNPHKSRSSSSSSSSSSSEHSLNVSKDQPKKQPKQP